MAYSDFNLSKLRRNFNIQQKVTNVFPIKPAPVPTGERLRLDIAEGLGLPLTTEKAKSELLIVPILREIKRRNPHFNFFSGYAFDVDKERELNGICDFILTAKADIVELEAPIFCIVEAKNGIIEEGYGQCGAAMLAARLFNQRDGLPIVNIYGAVTNAFDWVFLKLEGDTILIDSERYYLNELETLLGILEHIVQKYEPVGAELV